MKSYLTQQLSKTNSKIVYTLSTSTNDFESIYKNVSDLNNSLDSIDNKNLRFQFLIKKGIKMKKKA